MNDQVKFFLNFTTIIYLTWVTVINKRQTKVCEIKEKLARQKFKFEANFWANSTRQEILRPVSVCTKPTPHLTLANCGALTLFQILWIYFVFECTQTSALLLCAKTVVKLCSEVHRCTETIKLYNLHHFFTCTSADRRTGLWWNF